MNKTPLNNTQILQSVLYPGNKLCLEWTNTTEKIVAERAELEERLFKASGTAFNTNFLLILGSDTREMVLDPSLNFFKSFGQIFKRAILFSTKPILKGKKPTVELEREDLEYLMSVIPPMPGSEQITSLFLQELWENTLTDFTKLYATFPKGLEPFFTSLTPNANAVDRVHFHLVEKKNDDLYPFAFVATYSSLSADGNSVKQSPLKNALEEFTEDREKLMALLGAVKTVSSKSKLIASLLDSGELFHPIGFTIDEANRFLGETPLYESSGILCRIPKWWKKGTGKFSVKIEIGTAPTKLGSDALLDFNVGLTYDGVAISEEDMERIMNETSALIMVKGRWIRADKDSLQKAQEALALAKLYAQQNNIPVSQAIKHILGQSNPFAKDKALNTLENVEVSFGSWLDAMYEKMRNPKLEKERALPNGLNATLRPYQHTGYTWLHMLNSIGVGACLADDMGLGKTVQIIAFLVSLKESGATPRTSLVVLPTSLLENWRDELNKFAPNLSYRILHTSAMSASTVRDQLHDTDLVLTTYGMVVRNEWLENYQWNALLIDEAQAIKNSSTAQTKAIKKLTAKFKIALTGTPVENRVSDLWSIFDFINPGLLGTSNEFKNTLKSFEKSPEGFGRLRHIVYPYILRRLKSDKSIINDLPEKIETKVWAELSKKQRVIYSQLVDALTKTLESVDPKQTKGVILAYLTKFKQLCNHPDLLAGGTEFAPEASGKLSRLTELCEKIAEEREKVLVFTQYTEMITPLHDELKKVFGRSGVTLSGACSVAERKNAVKLFQEDPHVPYFIISVRAGGTGLNLTAACHVVHYDRWWNPAVENQATDRAFRIGQKKNVMVHKFITSGTIEEKIDKLIDEKKELAESIVGNSGDSITNLSNKEIIDLFTLKD